MNRKRTAAHPDESDQIAERPIAELTAERARTNEQQCALGEHSNLHNEKCNLAAKQCTERIDFETLLTEISVHFVNLAADRIDAQIEDAQRRICECLDFDLSSLWQWSDSSPPIFTVTHLHSPSGGPNLPVGIDAREVLPWVFERMLRGEVLKLFTESMPPEAACDQETRRGFGVQSSLVLPLSAGGGAIIGVLSFDILKEERPWPKLIVQRLQLVAQVFTNALARKQAETRLASLRRFESLVVDISTNFVNLPSDQIDAQIEDAQRRICECLDIDLSALWQWSDSAPHIMTVTHMHSPPEGPERPEGIDAREAFPWALERVLRGEELIYSTESMPPEAVRDQEMRRHFGIQSSVVIPLSAGGGPLIGVLTFDTMRQERSWEEPDLEKLRLLGQLFANALARKLNDRKLRESRARLSMATDAAGVGLWVMEAGTGSVWVTPRTRELFQFAEDEALDYASFDRTIDPADRNRVQQVVEAAIQTDEKLDIDFRLALPDGGFRWIKASGKRLPGTHGQVARLMGASIDISERKQMEAQLRNHLDEINILKQRLEKENIYLRKEIELKAVHKEIVGRSPAMLCVLKQVEQVSQTDATVLVEGETGTGKDLLARAIHQLSNRRKRPLVTVNCASLPPTLIESELFGREKGAYTGALTRMTGRFEVADEATLFLDEIGELPLDVQAKLLRVLEQGRFERLGSTQVMKVDVRIIAATNQDLAKQVTAGKFRKDLYYRLNVFPISLPPLRERPEDIPSLVLAFVRQYETKMGKRIDHISRQCMENLQRYTWPGNIRELRNVIERSLIVTSGRTLDVRLPRGTVDDFPEDLNLEETQRRHISGVLQKTGWRLSGRGGAAEILGLKRTTLQSTMKRLGIRRPSR
jgi:formate hydrogenlyase transcriptional activator